jgi:hypothetical protein
MVKKKIYCNIKNKKSRGNCFEEIIMTAQNKELKEMKNRLDKEIRLSETSIKEGFEKRR